MMLLQCFVIILAFNFSSVTGCQDNGYIESKSFENGLFLASFCNGNAFDNIAISDSVKVGECNAGSTCQGENENSYDPNYSISISSVENKVIFQYCDGPSNPKCSHCNNNAACTITMVDEGTYNNLMQTPGNGNMIPFFSDSLQMTFF